jgi:phosphoribosyl 1,2-cyclic phosphodiesterase
MAQLTVVCHGCRGSVPVSGPKFHRYGGGTTCLEIKLSEDHRLLIDAGTGALSMLEHLPTGRPLRFTILVTHLHWDHTFALPFFRPFYDPANRFDFYGHHVAGMTMEDALDIVMRPPWFPVNFRSTPAQKRFHHLEEDAFEVEDLRISSARLHHPDGVTAYRIERNGTVLCVATDVEHGEPDSDHKLRELAEGADVLIYDAQYLPDEYEMAKVGWGHSTWTEAVHLAKECGVGRLVLTSHDPSRSDDDVDKILAMARNEFPQTDAFYEGMVLDVG